MVFCATIARFASMLDGFFRNLVDDPRFVKIMQDDLETGVRMNTTEDRDYFTTAYFHTPEGITAEIQEGGFSSVNWYAVDGFGWLVPTVGDKLKDKAYAELLFDVLRRTEKERSLVGLSVHLLTVGTKA